MVLPSFTKTYHHSPYEAIDPTRPELSCQGKIIVITGGGTGIGAGAALSFAKASAKSIALLGRRIQPLQETKTTVEGAYPSTAVGVYSVDVTDQTAVSECFANIYDQYGPIDVCINGAAYLSNKGTIAEGSLDDFWTAFEVTVKGGYIIAQQFLRYASKIGPVLVGLNSLIAHLPASIVEQCPASYASSKIALSKLYEYVASENPHVRCYSLQPGVVETEMAAKSDAMAPPKKDNPFLPRDDVLLPGHFCVWLSSSEGVAVPSGRYLWSNWDVSELKERSAELFKDPVSLTMTLPGWPFPLPSD